MKSLQSLPSDKGFFDTYAPLAKKIRGAGLFAQIVSGLTEVGIIYTACLQALQPLGLGWIIYPISGAVAFIATSTIEVGLRETAPKAVDAILYKRFSGLHLPITVFVFLLAIVLGTTSGLLSFRNSSVIVDQFTPEAEQHGTTEADSIYQAQRGDVTAVYLADSASVAANYASQLQATETAYQAQVNAKRRQYSNVKAKERRTGQSFATQKGEIRAQIAELEAQQAGALAELTAAQGAELRELKSRYREGLTTASSDYKAATGEVKDANRKAEASREATVNTYGGGLGWFTVVCLFIFFTSVILERIYKKGAGIQETVQIESYDFRPGVVREWLGAIRERLSYLMHSRITAFANKTPSAPLPSQPGAVYDLAEALQHVTIKLQLDAGDDDQERTVKIAAKLPEDQEQAPRRRIGFTPEDSADSSCALYSPPTTNHETTNHEPPAPTEPGHETPSLREAKQRLKRYKKRLGSHQQKAIRQQKKSGKVCKRTADAVTNNQQWVKHYEALINKLENQ